MRCSAVSAVVFAHRPHHDAAITVRDRAPCPCSSIPGSKKEGKNLKAIIIVTSSRYQLPVCVARPLVIGSFRFRVSTFFVRSLSFPDRTRHTTACVGKKRVEISSVLRCSLHNERNFKQHFSSFRHESAKSNATWC